LELHNYSAEKGAGKMAEEKFTCAACGKEYDREMAVQECKICHRTHCSECISDEGICIPCEEKQKK